MVDDVELLGIEVPPNPNGKADATAVDDDDDPECLLFD